MLSENSVIRGHSGLTYQLGKEIGNGGEGRVFAVQGSPTLAVKLYKKDIPRQEEKLKHMVRNPIPELLDTKGKPIFRIAWPRDVLYDGSGKFVGYVMPFIDGGVEIFHIHRCCTAPKAKNMFPNYTWLLNVTVAYNLARAVDKLHQHNCVIGDMNCKNILVDRNGSIVFLDVDSFDITDPSTNQHYKCGAGTEDYLPPELQGRDLRNENSKFTVYSDYFALAVHIFQLLMDNFHPFTCIRREQMKDSSHHNPRLEQIGSGSCPYVRKVPGMDVPPSAPIIPETLPEYLARDFAGTFDYTEDTVFSKIPMRTSASVWAQHLEQLRLDCEFGQLVPCDKNPRHWYLASIGYCGHCKAEQRFAEHLARNQAKLQAASKPVVTPVKTVSSTTKQTTTSSNPRYPNTGTTSSTPRYPNTGSTGKTTSTTTTSKPANTGNAGSTSTSSGSSDSGCGETGCGCLILLAICIAAIAIGGIWGVIIVGFILWQIFKD